MAETYDTEWALTERFAEPDAYYVGGAPAALGGILGGDLEERLDYDVESVRAVLYVPDGEPPAGGWGVVVHVDADPNAELLSGWREAFDARRVIFVAPHDVGNDQDSALRIAWTLDALASVRAGWPVDPRRVVVSGFSGGAAIAVIVGAHWPETFVGTIDSCRAVMWELHEIATIPGAAFGTGEIDHLDPDHLDALVDGPRFAFVSGDADSLPTPDGPFFNYEGILDGIGDWWGRGIRARVWDVPGHAHAPAAGQAFDAALGWVLDCADEGLYPPRFDSDHLPPSTPFPTPDAAPPACVLPTEETTTPEAPGDPEASGCGCTSEASPVAAWGLALALLRRRARTTRTGSGRAAP